MLHKLRASTVSIPFAFAAILLQNFQIHVVNPITNHPLNQPSGWFIMKNPHLQQLLAIWKCEGHILKELPGSSMVLGSRSHPAALGNHGFFDGKEMVN